MYSIVLSAVAGKDSDIVKARVYVGSNPVPIEVDAQPNQPFQVSLQVPDAGPLSVQYTLVDGSGNESAALPGVVVVPDKQAPDAPTAPLQLVSVVWAA